MGAEVVLVDLQVLECEPLDFLEVLTGAVVTAEVDVRHCFVLFVVRLDLAVLVLEVDDDSDLHVLDEAH